MKTLHFTFRGAHYQVNEEGQISLNGVHYSPTWLFLGATKHHWGGFATRIKTHEAFENPKSINGCLGWDMDHGTIRQWGGRYNDRLPRITGAYID